MSIRKVQSRATCRSARRALIELEKIYLENKKKILREIYFQMRHKNRILKEKKTFLIPETFILYGE